MLKVIAIVTANSPAVICSVWYKYASTHIWAAASIVINMESIRST